MEEMDGECVPLVIKEDRTFPSRQQALSTSSFSSQSSNASSVVTSASESLLSCCIPSHWMLSSSASEGHYSSEVKNSPASTVVLLLNAMIGSGILVQAFVFREAGYLLATLEYLVIGYITYLGADVLIHTAVERSILHYAQLVEDSLGDVGKWTIEISVVIGFFGALLSYLMFIDLMLQSILPTATAWYNTSIFFTSLLVLLFVLPFCLVRHFGHLSFISYISITAISGTMLLVFIDGPNQAKAHLTEPLKWFDLVGCLETVGLIVFAFGYSNAIFHSFIDMEPQLPKVFSSVARKTTFIGAFMCYLLGAVGYLCFRDSTESNILLNFSGYLGSFFQIMIILHLLLYIPGEFFILRSSLLNMFNIEATTCSNWVFFSSTFLILASVTLTACLFQIYDSTSRSLSIVLSVTGGVSGSITYFFLPGLVTTMVLRNNPEYLFKGRVLVFFGALIPILVIYSIYLQYFG